MDEEQWRQVQELLAAKLTYEEGQRTSSLKDYLQFYLPRLAEVDAVRLGLNGSAYDQYQADYVTRAQVLLERISTGAVKKRSPQQQRADMQAFADLLGAMWKETTETLEFTLAERARQRATGEYRPLLLDMVVGEHADQALRQQVSQWLGLDAAAGRQQEQEVLRRLQREEPAVLADIREEAALTEIVERFNQTIGTSDELRIEQ